MGLLDQYYNDQQIDLRNSGSQPDYSQYLISNGANAEATNEEAPLTQEQIAALSDNPNLVEQYQNEGMIPEQYNGLAEFIAKQSGGRAPAETFVDSLAQMVKKNGGEIFANMMAGSAAGVMHFLASRRKSRDDSKLIDAKYTYEKQAKDAEVARASAMPTLTSVAKPSVSGNQLVGNQRQSGGLIGAVKQRSA